MAFLKMKVSQKGATSKTQLIQAIKKVWEEEIPNELIQNLCKSFKKRLDLVYLANGGHINY